ncbi:MAG: hypothetical protein CVU64_02975 [Deltaproteobacteria bacterium HGW-Deltaproteobacteria-21]|nr:MAG: hypothetical protein CVU64_02975 [Deltaproteobacteria bacterium HGW-Deltaproteobacteria-21]
MSMKVADAAGCFGASSVFLFGSALVPFLGPALGILTPLPFLFYGSKLGIQEGLKVSAVTIGLLAFISYLTGSLQLIFLAVEFCCLGLIISLLYTKGFTIGYTISWSTVLVLLLGLTALTFIGLSRGVSPFELIQMHIRESLNEAALLYEQWGVEGSQGLEVQGHLQTVTNAVLKVYLSLLVIGTGCVVWCNVLVSKPLFRLAGVDYPDFGPLDRWHSPERLVWGLIGSGFSLFLPVGFIQLIAINVLIVLMAVYLFHGLSILVFFLNKLQIPVWVRAGIYFLIIFQQVLLIVLALAGLFDQWIDFRRIHTKKGEPNH